MRRIQKLLIGVFLGGVLLGGIGTGVALVEYSSLTYGGEKQIGAKNLVTKDFDFSFEPEKGKLAVNCGWWDYESRRTPVETDGSIPPGTVRYEVTYNEKLAQPYLIYDEIPMPEENSGPQPSDEAADRVQGRLDVGMRRTASDFALWMECKDEVLSELKQRRISSYDVAYITDVKVRVHPDTLPYVIDDAAYLTGQAVY